MTVGGFEAYVTCYTKAAAIAESVVRNHAFNDANHRSAVYAAYLVLGLYGIKLVASEADQESTIRRLSGGGMTLDEYAAWLEANSILRTADSGA